MSDDTRAALDVAINAHVAASFPGYYTSGWVVVASSAHIDQPHVTNYRLFTADGQPLHVDEGLLRVGVRILDDSWDSCDDDDDDD